MPLTRFHIRTSTVPWRSHGPARRAGIRSRSSMRFLDVDGVDLDEATQRKIERLYEREESRRVLAAEIGDIDFPSRTVELYTARPRPAAWISSRSAGSRFKLVLDYAYGAASFVMPNVLAKLGADVLVINPHVSTPGVISFERRSHAERLAGLVRSSGAHLGADVSSRTGSS